MTHHDSALTVNKQGCGWYDSSERNEKLYGQKELYGKETGVYRA